MLTADHGATYGENFHGKTTADAGNSNWYYAPDRRLGRGLVRPRDTTRSTTSPSPDLQPLIDTGNIQFSYQSTAIEAWLIDHSVGQEEAGRHGDAEDAWA